MNIKVLALIFGGLMVETGYSSEKDNISVVMNEQDNHSAAHDPLKIAPPSAEDSRQFKKITNYIEVRNLIAYSENIPFTGIYERRYENEQKMFETNYKNGKRDGLDIGWYESGQKSHVNNFKDGKANGLFASWYESGKKQAEVNYTDGNKNGLSTDWYENGNKRLEVNYKDGKENGLWVNWNEGGQKKDEIHFIDGEMNGSATSWSDVGEKNMEVNFKNGKINNEHIEIVPEITENEHKKITSETMHDIIKRCQIKMGEEGPAMVKVCVDLDIKALEALGGYIKGHEAIVKRCTVKMAEYGYAMIKICSDQDIEAENALKKY